MMRSRAIRRTVLSVAVILVLGYALFEARGLLRGPVITIETPRSGETIREGLIRVTGRVTNAQAMTMNGRTIFLLEEGRIDEPVALLPGYNEIVFRATDRFGTTAVLELPLVYTPDDDDAPTLPAPAASSSPATSAEAATSTER